MSADMFGIHVCYRTTRSRLDDRGRLEALAQSLDLVLTGAPAGSAEDFDLRITRAGCPGIHINGFEEGDLRQLLIFEQFQHVAPYGAATIEALLKGLCLSMEAHIARAFRGATIDGVKLGEDDGPLTSLSWLQYLGPAHVERYGRLRLLAGPFFRMEPDETGGCLIQTRPIPFETGEDSGRRADEANPAFDFTRQACAHLDIPWRSDKVNYDRKPFTGPLPRDTMRVLQRPDFQHYADYNFQPGQKSPDREALLASLTITEIEELALLFEHGTEDERQTAFGLLYQLIVREDLRLKSPAGRDVRNVFDTIPSYASDEPRPSAVPEHELFEERFQATFSMQFAISDGRSLRIDPGTMDVFVRVGLGTERADTDGSDEVLLRLAFADAAGEVFEVSRSLRGDLLFRRFASTDGSTYSKDVPVIRDLRIKSDCRDRLPALGRVHRWGIVPFAYYLKYFGTRLDFWKSPGFPLRLPATERPRRTPDRLVLRVHPTRSGGVGYRPTPEVVAEVPSLAGLVLTPADVLGKELYSGDALPLVFTATGAAAPANANVHAGQD